MYLSSIYNDIPIYDVSFVPTNVNSWALKLPPSKKSRYLETAPKMAEHISNKYALEIVRPAAAN